MHLRMSRSKTSSSRGTRAFCLGRRVDHRGKTLSVSGWIRAPAVAAMAAEEGRRKRAAVVVLGDIGRSPRMQYHSLSLANQAGMEVDIVANGGSDPHLSLRENPSIHIHEMRSVKLTGISKISGALALLLKAAIQFVLLIWFLCFKIPRPDVFVVQKFEKYFGQMADGAFCVTKAMQHELAQNWGIRATVLYDQSPDFFHPASLVEKHGVGQFHL
ncbi:hypothetical protein ACP70R_012917 [Stipagrostis hirtigluma subsp. patula]